MYVYVTARSEIILDLEDFFFTSFMKSLLHPASTSLRDRSGLSNVILGFLFSVEATTDTQLQFGINCF